jgi:hypothetical protein
MLYGHLWTIGPVVLDALRPVRAPASDAIAIDVAHGVKLAAAFADMPGADEAVVIVHGLGGDLESAYVRGCARAAANAQMACLRVSLRGADRSGDDFYHAGLWTDLDLVLQHQTLSRFKKLYVVGYSLGGHVSLWLSAKHKGERLRAVAAIGAPIDLARTGAYIDGPERLLYRMHVLNALKQSYAPYARRHAAVPSARGAWMITSLGEWDSRVVAPRYGFGTRERYYAEASATKALPDLARPTLLLEANHDPMVPPSVIVPGLAQANGMLDVRFTDLGGHVAFPAHVDLGERAPLGVEAQVLAWLRRAAS